jgi:hypothetical protein
MNCCGLSVDRSNALFDLSLSANQSYEGHEAFQVKAGSGVTWGVPGASVCLACSSGTYSALAGRAPFLAEFESGCVTSGSPCDNHFD